MPIVTFSWNITRISLECTLEYYEILNSRFALEHQRSNTNARTHQHRYVKASKGRRYYDLRNESHEVTSIFEQLYEIGWNGNHEEIQEEGVYSWLGFGEHDMPKPGMHQFLSTDDWNKIICENVNANKVQTLNEHHTLSISPSMGFEDT